MALSPLPVNPDGRSVGKNKLGSRLIVSEIRNTLASVGLKLQRYLNLSKTM